MKHILTSVALALLTAGCASPFPDEVQTWKDEIPESFDMQILCPSNWHTQCTLDVGDDYTAKSISISPSRIVGRAQTVPVIVSIQMLTESSTQFLAQIETPEKAMDFFMDVFRGSFFIDEIEVAPTNFVLASGQTARRCQFRQAVPHKVSRTIFVLSVQSNTVVRAVFNAPINSWEKYQPIFEDQISSFRIWQNPN